MGGKGGEREGEGRGASLCEVLNPQIIPDDVRLVPNTFSIFEVVRAFLPDFPKRAARLGLGRSLTLAWVKGWG